MRVTTNDQVNASGFLRKLDVLIIPNVGQSNDPGNVLRRFYKVYSSLDGYYRVLEKSSVARIRDAGGGRGGHRNDCKVMLWEKNVRNQGLVESPVICMDVTGGDRECKVIDLIRSLVRTHYVKMKNGRSHSYKCSQDIISSIKFMVSNCHGIETELIEGLRNFLAAIKTVEQGALNLAVSHSTHESTVFMMNLPGTHHQRSVARNRYVRALSGQ